MTPEPWLQSLFNFLTFWFWVFILVVGLALILNVRTLFALLRRQLGLACNKTGLFFHNRHHLRSALFFHRLSGWLLPNDPMLMFNQASALHSLARPDLALPLARRARQLAPDDTSILGLLTSLLITTGDLVTALDCALDNHQRNPRDQSCLLTLSEYHFHFTGDRPQAQHYYNLYQALADQDGTVPWIATRAKILAHDLAEPPFFPPADADVPDAFEPLAPAEKKPRFS